MNSPFLITVAKLNDGETVRELDERLTALISSVKLCRKGGKLTFELAIKPQSDGRTVLVTDRIRVAAPEFERPDTLFFIDEESDRLERQDPRQRRMFEPPTQEPPQQ